MTPYISIVLVARNDDYGGDFHRRLSTFARSLGRQSLAHPGLFELVVVEWNPPANRPPLADAIEWPQMDRRIVTVPTAIHERVAPGGTMSFLEFYGKNAGIRRARGAFVLVTNADIIFTDELVDELATRRLEPRTFYRTDRYDYDGTGIEGIPDDRLLDFAASRVRVAHIRHGLKSYTPIRLDVPAGTERSAWPRSLELPDDEVRDDGRAIECRNEKTTMWGLHTNASGDFLLASQEAWRDTRGFWERYDTFNHLDSYCVIQMKNAGLSQTIFRNPLAVLHMDHPRVEQAGRPAPPYTEVYAELRKLRTEPGSLGYAHQTGWGLESVTLPETVSQRPRARGWPTRLAARVTRIFAAR